MHSPKRGFGNIHPFQQAYLRQKFPELDSFVNQLPKIIGKDPANISAYSLMLALREVQTPIDVIFPLCFSRKTMEVSNPSELFLPSENDLRERVNKLRTLFKAGGKLHLLHKLSKSQVPMVLLVDLTPHFSIIQSHQLGREWILPNLDDLTQESEQIVNEVFRDAFKGLENAKIKVGSIFDKLYGSERFGSFLKYVNSHIDLSNFGHQVPEGFFKNLLTEKPECFFRPNIS
jgi:hypothetical protein